VLCHAEENERPKEGNGGCNEESTVRVVNDFLA